jgi:hypothetical protein
MNIYRAVLLSAPEGGLWAVEHTADGVTQGHLPSRYATEAEALFAVYELARAELAKQRSD